MILKKIAAELGIRLSQAEAAAELIDSGCTIPFIARYRKEATGAMDDEVLRAFDERLKYLRNLEERKQTVLAAIEEQGRLTDELRTKIEAAGTAAVLEDLYRPYKPKRKTRAGIAREKGLQGLADYLMSKDSEGDPAMEAEKYVSEEKEVPDSAAALRNVSFVCFSTISTYRLSAVSPGCKYCLRPVKVEPRTSLEYLTVTPMLLSSENE